jgi:DNA polymerase-3 subunit delta'
VDVQHALMSPTEFDMPESVLDALVHGHLAHASLFIGTADVTEKAVRWLAQAILCEGDVRPCGACSSCIKFLADAHPDFFATSGTKVRTNDVEQLQSWLTVRGHQGKKVYALFGADSMTSVAANRMLKTLEEPEPHVYALLTAVQRHTVLSTIRSRCFTHTIHEKGAWPQADYQVVPFVHEALNPPENSSFDGFIDKMVRWTEMWLVERQPALILATKWQAFCGEISAEDSLTLLVEWLRDILYTRIGQSHIRFRAWESQVSHISPILDVRQWTRAIEIVLDSRQRLQSHVAALLNFEQMCIRLREDLS